MDKFNEKRIKNAKARIAWAKRCLKINQRKNQGDFSEDFKSVGPLKVRVFSNNYLNKVIDENQKFIDSMD